MESSTASDSRGNGQGNEDIVKNERGEAPRFSGKIWHQKYYFENEAQPEVFSSIFHSAWWSMVTLTTVGYGDVYPITLGGKIFTFFVLMIGVGFVTVPAGLVTTALSKARELEKKE